MIKPLGKAWSGADLSQKQIRIAAFGLRAVIENVKARILARSDHDLAVEQLEALREPVRQATALCARAKAQW